MMVDFGADMAKPRSSAHASIFGKPEQSHQCLELEQETGNS